jgi:hypothetical protein
MTRESAPAPMMRGGAGPDTARAHFAPPRAGISIPQFGNISISLLC